MNKLKNTTIASTITLAMITAIALRSMFVSTSGKSYEKTVDACARDDKTCIDNAVETHYPNKNLNLINNSDAFYKDNIIYLTSSFTKGVIEK
ncbi:MAG: hypothetical protein EOM05_04805 [Clostridia bacterium]|nr:hypothetical protein [Clostridia bacterium]